MSTRLIIDSEQWPELIHAATVVGDELLFTVRGRLRRIEAELVEISGYDKRDYLAGGTEFELMVTEIRRA